MEKWLPITCVSFQNLTVFTQLLKVMKTNQEQEGSWV